LRAVVFAALLLVGLSWLVPVQASDPTIVVRNGWSRATPGGAKVGAGYLVIENHGDVQDRLLAVEMAVAGRAEIHETTESGGVARMRQVQDLPISPHAKVELRPGGLHLMLMDLRNPLREGERLDGVLVFERAGRIPVQLQVEKIGAPASSGHGSHSSH
jgi:periplasmic copper chaperone A